VPGTASPENHGYFYKLKYVPEGRSFYCPSLSKNNEWGRYFAYENYIGQGFPSTSTGWNASRVRSSYNYYPQKNEPLKTAGREGALGRWMTHGKKLSELSASHTSITDLIYRWDALAHQKSKSAGSLNAAFGDGHVSISTTPAAFQRTRGYWTRANDFIVGNNPANFRNILAELRP
jgi:prepilin-type processing-associated H-X9-DG protein